MKTMKKFGALFLAIVMAMALAVPAMAVENEKTIKVEGLQAGDAVKYVQVIEWNNTTGWVKTTAFANLSNDVFNAVVGSTTTPGKITDASATAIAAIGADMTDGGSVATGATSWTKDNLAPGLYMVQPVATSADVIYNPVFVAIQADGTGSVVDVTNLNYDNNGTAKKSDVTVDKKTKSTGDTEWAEATTEDVGDIIDFKVETTVPAYLENYTNPVFTVSDALTDGLTYAVGDEGAYTTLTVKVGDTELTKDTDYTITALDATHWTISFTKDYLQGRTAATVVTITYQAMITDAAKNVNPESNTVTIDYSRNPSDATDHGTKTDKTTHYTFDIDAKLQGDENYTTSELIKVAQDSEGNPITEEKTYSNTTTHHPLDGAVFTLYKSDGTTPYTNSEYPNGVTVTSANGGLLEIKGLDEGTYVLKETTPASGYMLMTDYLEFTITATYKTVEATDTCNAYQELDTYSVAVTHVAANGDRTAGATSTYTLDNGTITKTGGVAGDASNEIVNVKGQSLPSTGGIGTKIFYTMGAVLVVGAGVVLVSRKRAGE